MLQSKNRTRKLKRQELSQYKRLVKLLDTNLGMVTQRGLYWKDQFEQAQAMVQRYSVQMMKERKEHRSSLILPEEKGLIILP
jgi:hypothetical protein